MKKIESIIHWFLILIFPFLIGFLVWETYTIEPALVKAATLAQRDMITQNYSGGIWDYIGIILIIWFVLAVFTIFRLLISTEYREKLLARIGMIRERDEREVEITGFASKFSMVASIALLFFFLFFNSMNFGMKKYHDHVIGSDGKARNGTISLGMSFKMLDEKALEYVNTSTEKEFNYKEIPLSKTGIIIVMIIWQMGTYYLAARKKLKN